MKIFEIHITGDETIRSILDYKTISIENLTPDGTILCIDHMTSHVIKRETAFEAVEETFRMMNFLKNKDISIERVKIECPFYEEYQQESIYIECHKILGCKILKQLEPPNRNGRFLLPTSRNKDNNKLMSTTRTYWKEDFENFRNQNKDHDVELCLVDTNIAHDSLWFSLYK